MVAQPGGSHIHGARDWMLKSPGFGGEETIPVYYYYYYYN